MGQHRSAAPPDYDSDFFAWTQHQARLIRTLRRWGELPPDVDLNHVAEEIEDLGKAEVRAVKSLIRQILVHLIKAASQPDAAAIAHWGSEATTFHLELLDAYVPSMRQLLDMQKLWAGATKIAKTSLKEHGAALAPATRERCPYLLQDIVSEDFQFDAALQRLHGGGTAG